jgi:predicted transport protein
MDRNIELLKYRQFGKDLLLLELVNPGAVGAPSGKKAKTGKSNDVEKPVAEPLAKLTPSMREVFESLEGFLASLGDDVQRKDLSLYVAFKRLRNFATVVGQKKQLRVFLHLDPSKIVLEEGFTRDVRKKGHFGTGDTEVTLHDLAQLEKAKPLLLRAYEGGSQAG